MNAGILWSLAIVAIAGWGVVAYLVSRRVPAEAVAADEAQQPVQLSTLVEDSLFESSPVGLCQLALDGRIVRVNRSLQALCGSDEDNLTTYFLPKLLHSDDVGIVNVVLSELVAGNGDAHELRSRLLHANGHSVWVHVAMQLVRSRGCPMHILVAITDIGDYMLAEQIAQSEQVKFAAIAAQVPVAVWLISPEWQIIFANDAFEALTGRPRESFFANPQRYIELVHPEDAAALNRSLQNHGVGGNYEVNYRMLRDDGEVRYIRQLGRGIYDGSGKLLYAVASAMDISSEMTARDELHALNSRLREINLRLRESVRLDGLTRCLNRVALFEEAEKALLIARRYQRSSTVIFFDLNNFKEINDSFGHHVGDRALIAFADQIKARLRTTDELGRYGGDEFVALLRETDAEQAMQLISTLPPVVVDNENGSSIILRFSAGVACSDDVEIESVDDWLRIADGLMYNQKIRLFKEGGARA